MKKIILVSSFLFGIICSDAQTRYTISGGFLGGANIATLKNDDVDFKQRFGFDAGVWANFPIGSVFSIEPQVMYSQRAYHGDEAGAQPETSAGFISVPIFAKASIGNAFAVMAGPEFSILTKLTDKNNNQSFETIGNDGFKKHSTSLTGGLEFTPHSRLVIYARYNYGLVDLYRADDGNTALDNNPFKNQSIHVGLKFKLFGHQVQPKAETTVAETKPEPKAPAKKEAPVAQATPKRAADKDSDGDGVMDSVDLCPNTVGLKDNFGCPEIVLYYTIDSAELTEYDKQELEKVVKFLKDHPGLLVNIEGHASTPGTSEHNQKLSEDRAKLSLNYLVSRGIPANTLNSIGFGERFPVGDNSTTEGRAKSRRVVVRARK